MQWSGICRVQVVLYFIQSQSILACTEISRLMTSPCCVCVRAFTHVCQFKLLRRIIKRSRILIRALWCWCSTQHDTILFLTIIWRLSELVIWERHERQVSKMGLQITHVNGSWENVFVECKIIWCPCWICRFLTLWWQWDPGARHVKFGRDRSYMCRYYVYHNKHGDRGKISDYPTCLT
jgi:hypothetical protein